MADAGCEWLIGLYLLQHALPNIFQQKCPDALQAWASQLASIFASKKIVYALKPMVPSAAFLTPNAARVQAQLSHKWALGSQKILAGRRNFFHSTQNPLPVWGGG